MVWTAPVTFVDGNTLTAAELNTYLRDNMLETMPAKATGQLRHFVSDGANRIVERQIFKSYIEAREITSSTSFVDLATVGPSVTVTTGIRALAIWSVSLDNDTGNATSHAAIAVSGATTIAAGDRYATIIRTYVGSREKRFGMAEMVTNLTPGSNTFRIRYKVGAGVGRFAKRHLAVWAF